MAVLFRGTGLAWIPAKHRSVRFVDGVYSTDDADEIAVLSLKYEHYLTGKDYEDAKGKMQGHWHDTSNMDATTIPDGINSTPLESAPRRGRKHNAVRDN